MLHSDGECTYATDSEDENELEDYRHVGNRDLYATLTECTISLGDIDKILNKLRMYTNPFEILLLPKTFKTAVGNTLPL